MAGGKIDQIQFPYSGGNRAFFDARSGDKGNFCNRYKVTDFGKDHGR